MKFSSVIAHCCVALFLTGCASSCDVTGERALETEFSIEFGCKPGFHASEIKCKRVTVGDTFSRWMRFTNDLSTLTNILKASGFKPVTDELLKDGVYTVWEQNIETPSPNAPSWWKRPTQMVGKAYIRDNPYSPSNSVPNFCFIWIDDAGGLIYSESCAWQ
jgi:hypothetical protein